MIAPKEERGKEQMQIFNCDSQTFLTFKIISVKDDALGA